MEDFALTPAERALFAALTARGVRFMVVGMGAAVLEGAPLATQDDVVLTAHGLGPFALEYESAKDMEIDGARLRILPLERVIASKRATNRTKDRAALPALEATLLAKQGK